MFALVLAESRRGRGGHGVRKTIASPQRLAERAVQGVRGGAVPGGHLHLPVRCNRPVLNIAGTRSCRCMTREVLALAPLVETYTLGDGEMINSPTNLGPDLRRGFCVGRSSSNKSAAALLGRPGTGDWYWEAPPPLPVQPVLNISGTRLCSGRLTERLAQAFVRLNERADRPGASDLW